MNEMENIEQRKEAIITAGCPLGRWNVGTRTSPFLGMKAKRLEELEADTKCFKFKKDIDEIGDYEWKKYNKLRYDGVPFGFEFITNSEGKKHDALKWAKVHYEKDYEIFVKDEAYYMQNIYDGVKELKDHVTVFLKRKRSNE